MPAPDPQEGRVYLVDYEILVDIPHYGTLNSNLERRYTCPALGLFYVKNSGDIVPIAIQLHQKPSKENPIWTPNDDELEWIYAKMWLRNADAQWHQVRIIKVIEIKCLCFIEKPRRPYWNNMETRQKRFGTTDGNRK